MKEDPKPIAVVGAGAVGTILAASLAREGHEVLLVECNPKRFAQLEQQGLQVSGARQMTARPRQLMRSIEELGRHHPRALFICTKTWSMKGFLPLLAKLISPGTLVVSWQNGLGPEDEIAEFFSPKQVARGIVNYAAKVDPAGLVTMQWFNAPNCLGPLDQEGQAQLVQLIQSLCCCGLKTISLSPNEIRHQVFFKVVLSSALNALCATSGITMRQAMDYDHTRNLAQVLIREGLSVASALGFNYGEGAMQDCLRYLNEGGDHLPSMWTDLQRGNPTEIEYINGKMVKLGLMFKNINVDANIFFTAMVVTEEIRSGARRPDQIPDYLKRF